MKKQVFVIHGGNAFNTYEEYISYLKIKEASLERLFTKDWKGNLSNDLGEDFNVYILKMPNSENAKYEEWKIWFEKYITFMNDGVILIGHSLGGVFLAKYLSENNFNKKILGTFLVATPYNRDKWNILPSFNIVSSLNNLEKQAGKLHMYHSKDDVVVNFSEFEKYQSELLTANFRVFEDRQHFNMESFPEIITDIRGL